MLQRSGAGFYKIFSRLEITTAKNKLDNFKEAFYEDF